MMVLHLLHISTLIGMLSCIATATRKNATQFDKISGSFFLGAYIIVFIILFFAY